jgi:hypothetical protein
MAHQTESDIAGVGMTESPSWLLRFNQSSRSNLTAKLDG